MISQLLVIVADVDLYRYELPLTTPIELGTETTGHRRGLLVRLTTADGAVGWGEAAPLPGFSAETLADVIEHAHSGTHQWTGTRIPFPEDSLDRALRTLPAGDACPASLRFALESAVVDLLATADRTSLAAVLGAPRSTVELNALIPDLLDGGEEQAARLRDAGYRAVKVKVGRGGATKEADHLRALRRALGDEIALRLDANRAWSMEVAVAFAEALGDVGVAYIEEPLTDPARLEPFVAQTGLPVALDETTREVGPEVLREHPVSAVVLKPTLLGGLRKTRQWIWAAREHDVAPVISAAYESGLGLRMLVALAATTSATPAGLSTYERLASDVLTPRLPLNGPTVEVGAVTASEFSIDWSRLDPLNESS